MEIKTHLKIDNALCGEVVSLEEGSAKVVFKPVAEMAADEKGLVHGGFIFGAADYAAMVAVNDPYVVLGAADIRFLSPVKLGDTVTFQAKITETKGRKRVVSIEGISNDKTVFTGTLACFVLEQHVLG